MGTCMKHKMIYVKHKIYIYMGTHGKIKKYLNSVPPRVYNENKMVFYWNFSLKKFNRLEDYGGS
ncbi:MAG: hypothetical protein DRI87_07965 [Bacteroidetes bacterium]|nr:MAG: hypothetical protein DRI87_07965 [Bacteroidota bacterium]